MTVGLAGGLFGMIMGLFGALMGIIGAIFKFLFHGFTGFHDLHFFSHPGIWITCLVIAVVIILSVDKRKK